MSNIKFIITGLFFLLVYVGNAQIEENLVKTNYNLTATSKPLILEASRSITIKPNSHLVATGSSSIILKINSEIYLEPTFTSGNYVFSRSYQKPLSSSNDITNIYDVIEEISYYDGLGRISQNVKIKFTPDRHDLIKHSEYDDLGRAAKEFLLYKATGDNGLYRSDALSAVNTYYLNKYGGDLNASNPNPFSEKKFEDAVLNRPLKQASPGYDWRMGGGNEIEYDYKLNTSTDAVRYFKVTFPNGIAERPQLEENSVYGINELTRNIVKDENHSGTTKNHTTEEFKDKRGRTVLKRSYADVVGSPQEKHDTYYVYDDYGNLTYVIPPEASKSSTISSAILNNICYQYRYDYKNRLIEKKLPGKGGDNNIWESIVYNINDQPILKQDPNLKASNTWLFTKYDAFGRIAYTGLMFRNATRATLQNEANAISTTFVQRKSATIDGINIGYDNNAYPINDITEIYTVNYYDNYNGFSLEGLTVPATVYGESTNVNTVGLPTCTKVRVVDWPRNQYFWVTTVLGYDKEGRTIFESQSTPDDSGPTITNTKELKLDFTGRTLETKTTHKRGSDAAIVTTDVFDYDHMGRLLIQKQTIGSHTEVLVSNVYDDLGNVEKKKLGNTESTPLQTVDYSYNIRGWLKEINNVNSLGNDLFAFKLSYNAPEVSGVNATPLFNGNISETIWRTKNDDNKRAYGYSYDALNRLKTSSFTDDMSTTTGQFSTNYAYDRNGNLQSLLRNGWQNGANYASMDNLVYSYETNNPNKLVKVQDNGNDNYGFKDLANTSVEYTYDANGNMLTDANKNITSISYNFLNLPKTVTMTKNGSTSYISYTYDAAGAKLKKTVTNRTVTPNQTTTTVYSDNYIYENGDLKFIQHPEGYLEPTTNFNYKYVYHFKDQLGNVRVGFSDVNNNGSVDASEITDEKNYYPFGLTHNGYNMGVDGVYYPYGFNGKEENLEMGLDWLDFSARNYNPEIGRWMNIDPLASDFPSFSPYIYSLNNPILFIDSDGKAPDPVLLSVINLAIQNNAIRQATIDANTYLANYKGLGIESLEQLNILASIPNESKYRYTEPSMWSIDPFAPMINNNVRFRGEVSVGDVKFTVDVNYDKKSSEGMLEITTVIPQRDGENRDSGSPFGSGYKINFEKGDHTVLTMSVKDDATHKAFEKAQKDLYNKEFNKLLKNNPILKKVYEIELLRKRGTYLYTQTYKNGVENTPQEDINEAKEINKQVQMMINELKAMFDDQ